MKIFKWSTNRPYLEYDYHIIANDIQEAREYGRDAYSLEKFYARTQQAWNGEESSAWEMIRDTEPEVIELEPGVIIEHVCEW